MVSQKCLAAMLHYYIANNHSQHLYSTHIELNVFLFSFMAHTIFLNGIF